MTQASALRDATPICIVCTRDRDRATAFYRDVLGLTLLREDNFATVFATGGVTLHVSKVADWTAHEHTILGFEVRNIDTAVAALTDGGVAFLRFPGFTHDSQGIWTAPDKSARVAWFKDPDGNLLSVTQFN